jgi:hypothetical protein
MAVTPNSGQPLSPRAADLVRLAAGSASVAGFVDDMVARLSEQLRRERAELARSSHARRFEVVSLILDNAPITTGRASALLGYELRRRHTAAVLWTDPRRPDQVALAAAACWCAPAFRRPLNRRSSSPGCRGRRGRWPSARGGVRVQAGRGTAEVEGGAGVAGCGGVLVQLGGVPVKAAVVGGVAERGLVAGRDMRGPVSP